MQQLARPQPRALEHPAGEPEYPLGAGSATGFVGMLARGQTGSDDSQISTSIGSHKAALPVGHGFGASPRAERKLSLLPRCRTGRPAPPAPGHAIAAPLFLAMSLFLFAISAWAIGALVYIHEVTPLSPPMPAIPWWRGIRHWAQWRLHARLAPHAGGDAVVPAGGHAMFVMSRLVRKSLINKGA